MAEVVTIFLSNTGIAVFSVLIINQGKFNMGTCTGNRSALSVTRVHFTGF